jgi:hypothetical protein
MTDSSARPSSGPKPSREERLAAKLRENLRRRKEQARSLQNDGESEDLDMGVGERDSPELPKPPGTR